jgi:hypothetical protein
LNISIEALAIPIAIAALGFAFKVSRDVVTLQTQMSVIWPQVKLNTALALHSPDNHRGIDELLVKYAKGTIDKEELAELVSRVQALESRTDDEEERLKAQGLLRLIRFEYQV